MSNDRWDGPPTPEEQLLDDADNAPRGIYNIEAEAALLGALMIDNRLVDMASGVLTADDFYEPIHQRIFKTIVHLRNTDTLATPVTLRPYFERDEQMRQVGGPGYLASLTGSGAGLIGARDFASQIRDLAIIRAVDAEAEAIRADLAGSLTVEFSVSQRTSDMAARIMTAGERAQPAKFKSGGDMMRRVRARQEELRDGGSVGAMCRTVTDINELLGPLAGGQMTILAGRPSMGKSVVAQSVLWGCALAGHGAALFSNEMSEDGLALRLAADLAHAMNEVVDYKHILLGKLTESELLTVDAAGALIEKYPFRTISPERPTIEEIESRAILLAAEMERKGHRLEVLGIDYVQLLHSSQKFDSRAAEISHISGRLLRLFKRLNCHGLVLSQVGRDVDKRPDHRPTLSDLRESGRLEEDADNVVFVYRPEYYLEREKPAEGSKDYEKTYEDWNASWQKARGKVQLIGAKIRQGEIQTVKATFIGSSQAVRSGDWIPPLMTEEGILS